MKKHKIELLQLNKSGSSMIFVLMLMMVFTIFSVAVLSVGASYHQRTLSEVNKKQAYLNARSVVDLVASDIMKDSALAEQVVEAGIVGVILSDFEIDGKAVDAKVAAVYFPDDGTITLIGRATVGNEKKSIALNMKKTVNAGDDTTKDPIIPDFASPLTLDDITVRQYFVNSPNTITEEAFQIDKFASPWINETMYFKLKDDIYIFVKNNSSFSIKDIVTTDTRHNVFIILGNESELTIGANDGRTLPIYIYGKKGTVRVKNDIFVSGYVVVGNIVSDGGSLTPLNQIPNNPNMDIGGRKFVWSKVEYWDVK